VVQRQLYVLCVGVMTVWGGGFGGLFMSSGYADVGVRVSAGPLFRLGRLGKMVGFMRGHQRWDWGR
jgi:hypothetical protein